MPGPLHGVTLTVSNNGTHAVWGEVFPEFKPGEFRRPWNMSVEALRLHIQVRRQSKVPFRIVSDSRLESQGIGAQNSAHNEIPCTALDLRVHTNNERFRLVKTALDVGAVRIGIYPPTPDQIKQFGKAGKWAGGSVHIDFSPFLPPEVIWMAW